MAAMETSMEEVVI